MKEEDCKRMNRIDERFTEPPYYGAGRMATKVLKNEGYEAEHKKISKYYRLMALEAIYLRVNLSKRNQAHKVYPYLLNGFRDQ